MSGASRPFETRAESIQPRNAGAEELAREQQRRLTKPIGSLGVLEDVAIRIAGIRGEGVPGSIVKPAICVFAADHGVVAEGVSAYPQEITTAMVANMASGGAAINVLARQAGALLRIVDVGVADDLGVLGEAIVHRKIRKGTRNLATEAAMTRAEAEEALSVGEECARGLIEDGCDLLAIGEVGIGNTTAAAALVSSFAALDAELVVGRGTGVDDRRLEHKTSVVRQAVQRCIDDDAVGRAARLGGFELLAMSGFLLGAARGATPVVLDGFLSSAAALVARALDANVTEYCFASHVSAERGGAIALQALGLRPILQLDLRLGEGTGAALAIPIVRSAVALHREMATFADAGMADERHE